MDRELFVSFLHHVSDYVKEKSIPLPVLLFVDGHATHMSRAAAQFCSENGIILYCLLPNVTHILQPCDVGFFAPMKAAWKRCVKSWQFEYLSQSLTKKDFSGVFKLTWNVVATIEKAINGFRKSGFFPLDPKGIDISQLEPSKHANPVRNCGDAPEHSSEASPKPV